MKLLITYFPDDLTHPQIKALVGDRIATKECLWGSALSDEYLKEISSVSSCKVRLSFSFTDKQCERYSHFILRPKHLITESDSVYRANAQHIEQQPLHHEDEFGRYRLRSSLYAANIKPLFDRIWSMEFSAGYIIEESLLREMMRRFSGLHEIPLVHVKSHQPFDEWKAFDSSSWLTSLSLDDSVETPLAPDGKKCLNPLGLLSAREADLEKLADVARLPSATTQGDSEYIVSQSVWQFWREKGINSFRPEPLLNTDSTDYQQYLDLVNDVKSRLAINPHNRIRSRP